MRQDPTIMRSKYKDVHRTESSLLSKAKELMIRE
ncbi:MAG: hypothetical protein RLZZ110_1514, partial [Bacteroidota bacterium]